MVIINKSVLVEMERKALDGDYDRQEERTTRRLPCLLMDTQAKEVKGEVTKENCSSQKKKEKNRKREKRNQMDDLSHDGNDESVRRHHNHFTQKHCRIMSKVVIKIEQYENLEKKRKFITESDNETVIKGESLLEKAKHKAVDASLLDGIELNEANLTE